jgi:mannosyltransferase
VLGLVLLLARPGRGGVPDGGGGALALVGGWALLPPALLLATYPMLHTFLYRYLLVVVPACALLAAHGLVTVVRMVPRRAARAVLVVVAIGAIGFQSVPAQSAVRQHVLAGAGDFDAVGMVIAVSQRPGDGIAFGGTYPRARRAMMYVMRDWTTRPRDVFLTRGYAQSGDFVGRECRLPASCLGGTARIWLVTTAPGADPYAQLRPADADLLRSRFTIVQTGTFSHVRVLLLALRPTGPKARGLSLLGRATQAGP